MTSSVAFRVHSWPKKPARSIRLTSSFDPWMLCELRYLCLHRTNAHNRNSARLLSQIVVDDPQAQGSLAQAHKTNRSGKSDWRWIVPYHLGWPWSCYIQRFQQANRRWDICYHGDGSCVPARYSFLGVAGIRRRQSHFIFSVKSLPTDHSAKCLHTSGLGNRDSSFPSVRKYSAPRLLRWFGRLQVACWVP